MTTEKKYNGVEQVTYYEISSGRLEDIIKQHFGKKYEIAACEEWDQHSTHTFIINGRLSEADEERLEEWKADEQHGYVFMTPIFLEALAENEAIPPGRWLIRVNNW